MLAVRHRALRCDAGSTPALCWLDAMARRLDFAPRRRDSTPRCDGVLSQARRPWEARCQASTAWLDAGLTQARLLDARLDSSTPGLRIRPCISGIRPCVSGIRPCVSKSDRVFRNQTVCFRNQTVCFRKHTGVIFFHTGVFLESDRADSKIRPCVFWN